MAIAYSLEHSAPRATLRNLVSDFTRALSSAIRIPMPPNPGLMPAEMRVSKRAWRRNSAMLMSIYEDRGVK